MADSVLPSRRSILLETAAVTVVTLVAIRLVVQLMSGVAFDLFLALVPILFMYVPVWTLQARGEDPDKYPLALPLFSDASPWLSALKLNLLVIGAIVVPWLGLYHLYQTTLVPWFASWACDMGLRQACALAWTRFEPSWRLPAEPLKLIGYHLFFVAIPEEMFYRGYLQSRLDEVWVPKWRVFGADLGPSWLITSVVFAFGHSLVQFQWWHFAIFFPSLVFGWMRARTGGIIAGAFFHAWSNITVAYLDTIYGVIPP